MTFPPVRLEELLRRVAGLRIGEGVAGLSALLRELDTGLGLWRADAERGLLVELAGGREVVLGSWGDDPVLLERLAAAAPLGRSKRRLVLVDEQCAWGVVTGPAKLLEAPAFEVLLALLATKLADLDELSGARERLVQLSALYDTAHEMSAQLQLDQVLTTVCARARALTGAEIAYIMLIDADSGDCFIRASEGVRTEGFKAARLALGQGLGGLVAKEGRSYYSSDYATDPRFEHVIDQAVAGEGVVSVMGAPLLVQDAVIGILFAAYRSRMPFSEADSAFLESLGEHAAIALANARLFGQAKEALDRERVLRGLAEEQGRELERASEIHERLSELMLSEQSVDELLAAVGDTLGCHVALEAERGAGLYSPVAAGREHLGWLCAEPDADIQRSALEQAARVLAAHLLRESAVLHAQHHSRSELLKDLLSGAVSDGQELARRARYFGIDLGQPLVVAWVSAAAEQRPVLAEHVTSACARQAEACLVSPSGAGVVVVSNARDGGDWAKRVATQLPSEGYHLVGLTEGRVDLARLGAAVEEARSAADAARATGQKAGSVVTQRDLGIYPLLLRDDQPLRAYAERLIRPLLDYDIEHRIDLVQTLEVYLRCGGRRTQAAAELRLHANSLYYRLGRIREIADLDLDDAEVIFELTLALKLHHAYSVTAKS